ncbi:MAG TPA: hypothetical protein VKU41_04445, partial [Polyangiaceae bacterium]|nr:hypothetical protein [Polyangiaceae bacterium]
TFVVAEGARRTVTLSLHSLPIARQPATAAQRLRGEQVPPPDEASGSTPFGAKAGIAALGLGGAGLLVGGVTGVLVLVKHAALTRACPDGHCPPSESGDVATYHALAAVSTVSTLVGAGAAVVGAALLIATPRTAPVAVYAGFLRIEIVGSFR